MKEPKIITTEEKPYIIASINTLPTELDRLKLFGMPIRFYETNEAHYDEIGGYHDCAEGWSPNGTWCGECTKASCKNCPNIKEDK